MTFPLKFILAWVLWASVNYIALKHLDRITAQRICLYAHRDHPCDYYWSQGARAKALTASIMAPMGTVFVVTGYAYENITFDTKAPARW